MDTTPNQAVSSLPQQEDKPSLPTDNLGVPSSPKPTSKLPPWVLIALGLGIIGAALATGLTIRSRKPTGPEPTPTPTVQQITPGRVINPIATTSAFLALAEGVASLSSALSTFNATDTTINPPALDLPLGFSK